MRPEGAAVRSGNSAWLLDVADATNPSLCGGKAVGLAKLQHAGFAVPAAICLTTAFYRRWLETSGLAPRIPRLAGDPASRDHVRSTVLAELRRHIELAPVPDDLEAALDAALARLSEGWEGALSVRSSAVHEDEADASHAGIHTSLVVGERAADAVLLAVKACWASLWTDAAWIYRERRVIPHTEAEMAVVVQRFIEAERSGIAFSADPLAGDRGTVVIEAAWGTGTALVSGRITPDEYRVTMAHGVPVARRHRSGRQEQMTAWQGGREVTLPVSEALRAAPVLSEAQALELAGLVRAVERTLQVAVDVEWVFDARTFWAVQARPITALAAPPQEVPSRETLWTRANLKEVFPELPSPLTLSYLSVAMNRMFASYHSAQGYTLPPGAQLVRVFRGRPYLNLTLMHEMTMARGGDPSVVARLFGGVEPTRPPAPAPAERPSRGIGDHLRLAREMLATFFRTPSRGRRLFRMIGRQGAALRRVPVDSLDDRALVAHLERFGATLFRETPVRRLHEVISAQSRAYMVLERLVASWIPGDSETLVKRLMTGLGTLPNVRMTYSLMAIGALAASEARARSFFAEELGDDAGREYRDALAGTRCLAAIEDFLREFGHRGPYESDVMSPRFSEDPTPVLRIIQLHLRVGTQEDPARHAVERRLVRQAATDQVRRELRRGQGRLAFAGRWIAFSIVCDALQQLLALRDECRHVTTSMVAHLRRVALELGRRATRDGLLASPDDIFFLSWEELGRVLTERHRDWRGITLARRIERESNGRLDAPDLLGGEGVTDRAPGSPDDQLGDDLVGFGVSPGTVTGTVKLLRSAEDARHLMGEIVVCPAMEPTLTPVFPLVRGMIAEMGGLLSHASILAREYGLPAVVNVPQAVRRLRDGDRVELDGTTGRVRVLGRAAG